MTQKYEFDMDKITIMDAVKLGKAVAQNDEAAMLELIVELAEKASDLNGNEMRMSELKPFIQQFSAAYQEASGDTPGSFWDWGKGPESND